MSNKSISQLTAGAAVSSTDLFPDVQTVGVGPVKVTAAQLGDYVLSGSGLTGVLPVSRGGTGLSTLTAANYALYSTSASALTAGTLPVAAGGTGLTSLTAGYIPYGNGTGAFSSSSGLSYNGTTQLSVTGSVGSVLAQSTTAGNNAQFVAKSTAQEWRMGVNMLLSGNQWELYDVTAGLDRIVVTSAGNVGIGTSSPGYKLDIVAADNTSLASTIRVNSNNLAVNTNIAYDGVTGSGQLTVQAGSSSALIFGTNATEKMRITSAGDVGIGTTGPVARLQVVGANGAGLRIDQSNYNYYGAYSHVFMSSGFSSTFMTLDSAGNLGLGVTPSAWNSSWKAVDVGARSAFVNNGSGNTTDIWHNAFVDGSGTPLYKTTAAASFYRLTGGAFNWFTAASGSAGTAASFTQAMTLDASSNLSVVGTVTGENFQATNGNWFYWGDASTRIKGDSSTSIMQMFTGGSERARITSAGDLLVGVTSSTGKVTVASSAGSTSYTNAHIALRNGNKANDDRALVSTAFVTSGDSGYCPVMFGGIQTDNSNRYGAFAVYVSSSDNVTPSSTTERLRVDNSGNLLVGTTNVGTSGATVLAIATGTAPTTGPADTIQIFSTDLSAGNTMLSLRTEGTPVNANTTAAATHRIAIRVNGTVYYLLANTSA